MRPQHQTLFGGADHPAAERGNCFAACIATLLEVELASLPNFCAWPASSWWDRTNEYLSEHFGLWLINLPVERPEVAWAPENVLRVANGPGPRGHRHSVVYDGKGLVHDPHPSGAGLLSVDSLDFLCAATLRHAAPRMVRR